MDEALCVEAVRRFSRFYTRQVGVLHEGYNGSEFSLTEARIIYELAHREAATASDLAKYLGRRSRLPQPPPQELPGTRRDPAPGLGRRCAAVPAEPDRARPAALRRAQRALAHRHGADAERADPTPAAAPDQRHERDRDVAVRRAGAQRALHPAAASARRHRLGGAEARRALCARIRLRRQLRGAGGGDRLQVPEGVRSEEGARLDRREGRRECRLRVPDQARPTRSPSCACCWSTRRRAASASASAWWRNASGSREQRGYKKITLWTNDILVAASTSTSSPASSWWPRSGTTASATRWSGRRGNWICSRISAAA